MISTASSPASRARGDRGLTLVELLVTIAVIVILAALLLPVINRALKGGYLAGATAQMHLIGYGFASFANDNNNMYPIPWNQGNGAILNSTQQGCWASTLAQGNYLGGKTTQWMHQNVVAPGVNYKKPGGGSLSKTQIECTYDLTDALVGIQNGQLVVTTARSVTGIQKPSQTYILFQGMQSSSLAPMSDVTAIDWIAFQSDATASSATSLKYVDFPYNGIGLFLRADGSIAGFRQDQLKTITRAQWSGTGF